MTGHRPRIRGLSRRQWQPSTAPIRSLPASSPMKRSTDRILTSHVGSLIRPPALIEFLRAQQERRPVDDAAFAACLTASVAEIVRQQVEAGVDVVSDGEFGKTISWSQYAL